MKPILFWLTACLCLNSQAAGFSDPLTTPARSSVLASKAPVNGLARAGHRLVAVGQRGHILYSDNGGRDWRQAEVPVSVDLTAAAFVNAREGWAVGHDGVILHSADGGEHWQRQADGRNGDRIDDRPLLDIWMADNAHGIAVGAFGLARCTDDGGKQWRSCEDSVENPQGLHLNAIRAIGGAVYIAGEQGLLLRRAAGATRFTPLAMPYRGSLFGIAGDGVRLLAFGLRGNAWFSRDGGASWEQSASGVRSGLAAGLALPTGGFVLVSQTGQVLFSEGGRQFASLPGVQTEPATAALLGADGALVTGGVRGLRVQALPRP